MTRSNPMILVVGGLNGFVGSNTTEALVKQGTDCVVTQHKSTEVPRFLEKYVNHHVFIEPADTTSISDLRRIGEKYKIEGIIDVAGFFRPKATSAIPDLKGYFDMLTGIFQVAEDWKVKRVIFSSTAGMYLGLDGSPIKEDRPIFLDSPFPIIAYQKIVEIATAEFAKKSGISCACVRLIGMFGPGQDPAAGISLPPALVHAAVSGKPPVLEDLFGACVDDGDDLCYIKDMGRAIALLQTTEKLNHGVYNVSSGKVIPNRELVEAIQEAVPGFKWTSRPGALQYRFRHWISSDLGRTRAFLPPLISDLLSWTMSSG